MAVVNGFVGFFINFYAILATVPFLVFPIIGLSAYALGKEKKAAVQLAMDVTTFFLIGSVAVLYDRIFHTGLKGVWIVLLVLLLMTGFLGNAQTRIRGKVNMEKLMRAVWRLGFLLLAVFYVLFIFIGSIKGLTTI